MGGIGCVPAPDDHPAAVDLDRGGQTTAGYWQAPEGLRIEQFQSVSSDDGGTVRLLPIWPAVEVTSVDTASEPRTLLDRIPEGGRHLLQTGNVPLARCQC